MRYALLVAYDGTNYGGWQTQVNSVTVQEMMERAASAAFSAPCAVVASGRTDSGVHAAGQVCHVDAPGTVPGERAADALNRYLPDDIAVLRSREAPDGFDANRSAKRKTYVYRMYSGRVHNPLEDRYALFVKGTFDAERMNTAAALFAGEHDFAAYKKSRSSAVTTVRTVFSSRVYAEKGSRGDMLCYEVCGNGFLYNMVRTMAGTVLGYASGKITLTDIAESLEKQDRSLTGRTLPACGLTLEGVDYGFPLFP